MYTDANGNGFSDNDVRPLSDILLQLYHDCTNLKTQRDADASITITIQNHEPWIRFTATRFINVFQASSVISNQWFSRMNDAKTQNIASDIPNDLTEMATSTEGRRPAINGQDVHRFSQLTQEFQNYMNDGLFGGPGTGSPEAMINTLIVVGDGTGNIVLTESDVANFIDNRCVEVRNEYEANNNLKLSWIQRTAVNVRMFGQQ